MCNVFPRRPSKPEYTAGMSDFVVNWDLENSFGFIVDENAEDASPHFMRYAVTCTASSVLNNTAKGEVR